MTDSNTRTIHQEAPSECITLRKYMLRHPNGETQSIERRLIYLGSAPDGEVVIDDSTVSRVHCKIEVDRHGHRIRDLESKNGTFINGIRISDAYLPADCTLKIGESEFGFQLGSESVEVQLATSCERSLRCFPAWPPPISPYWSRVKVVPARNSLPRHYTIKVGETRGL